MANGAGALSPAGNGVVRQRVAAALDLDKVCTLIGQGTPFKAAAAQLGVSTTDLWVWIREDSSRMAAYEAAVEAKAHLLVDEAHALADRVTEGELDPKRADMKVKLIQWTAGKARPYQDRKTVEHQHTVKLDAADLAARLEQLMQVANQRAALTIEHEPITHDAQQSLP